MIFGSVQSSVSGGVVQSSVSGGSGHSSGGVQTELAVGEQLSTGGLGSRQSSNGGSNADRSTTTTTTDYHRVHVREFKIANGSVGVEGSLDYSDLIMQMKEGLAVGYSHKEVMSGVVRATKPGSELRRYLVRKGEMPYEDFKQTLREFYNVRESQAIMDEMREMVQGETQDLLKYVMSMCALRDEVFEVSASEECPPGGALVKKRFVDSLLSGLLKPTVRLEMQAILKLDLPDPKLFSEVNQIAKRVEENEKKVGGGAQRVNVRSVDANKKQSVKVREDKWKQETAAKLELLTTQVTKLEALLKENKLSKPNESLDGTMARLLGQVQHLTSQMQEYQSDGSDRGSRGGFGSSSSGKFKFRKCADCERDRKFCRHCRKCKQEGHKEADCPEN